jgi:hypothetical protein
MRHECRTIDRNGVEGVQIFFSCPMIKPLTMAEYNAIERQIQERLASRHGEPVRRMPREPEPVEEREPPKVRSVL